MKINNIVHHPHHDQKAIKKGKKWIKNADSKQTISLAPNIISAIKAANNAIKLKNEIRQKLFCISITKSQKHKNQVIKIIGVYIDENKLVIV